MTTTKERAGSSQAVYATRHADTVVLRDQGLTSVFDAGPIPGFESEIIAKARTMQTVCFFEHLSRHSVPTHFLGREDETAFRARECRILDKELLSEAWQEPPVHLNLELLFRIRASKKFCDRVQRGEVSRERLRLPPRTELIPGMKLPEPYVEASTKWQEGGDAYLTDAEAAKIAGISDDELSTLFTLVGLAGMLVSELLESLGFENDDGKFEAARDPGTGMVLLIDRLSLDELGVRKGEEPYGKNLIREYYKEYHEDWYEALLTAKKEHPTEKPVWPPYPPLPAYLTRRHETRYAEVAAYLNRAVLP